MLTQNYLYAKALLVEKPWFVKEINFDTKDGKLEIWIGFDRGSTFYYEDKELGIKGEFKAYDTKVKTWRHLNFFQYQCYLHAWVPRVDLGNGKFRQVHTPWDDHSLGFTLLFEALILELARVMPVRNLCQLFDIDNNKVWTMLRSYTELARQEADYSEVEIVGFDETSIRKGHEYISMAMDFVKRRTMFATEVKDHTVVKKFALDLVKHGGLAENIKQVSCDMSSWHRRIKIFFAAETLIVLDFSLI